MTPMDYAEVKDSMGLSFQNIAAVFDKGYEKGMAKFQGQLQDACNSARHEGWEKGIEDFRNALLDKDFRDIFRESDVNWILENANVHAITNAIKSYAESKEQESIAIGDQIESAWGRKGVVLGKAYNWLYVLWADSNDKGRLIVDQLGTHNAKKTGKHFDDVENMVKQMVGD